MVPTTSYDTKFWDTGYHGVIQGLLYSCYCFNDFKTMHVDSLWFWLEVMGYNDKSQHDQYTVERCESPLKYRLSALPCSSFAWCSTRSRSIFSRKARQ